MAKFKFQFENRQDIENMNGLRYAKYNLSKEQYMEFAQIPENMRIKYQKYGFGHWEREKPVRLIDRL